MNKLAAEAKKRGYRLQKLCSYCEKDEEYQCDMCTSSMCADHYHTGEICWEYRACASCVFEPNHLFKYEEFFCAACLAVGTQ
jgi:hypothetical protein